MQLAQRMQHLVLCCTQEGSPVMQILVTVQIVADVFQLPVVLPMEAESAALGVALQAAAVHRGIPVGEFIQKAQPPVAEQVLRTPTGEFQLEFGLFAASFTHADCV